MAPSAKLGEIGSLRLFLYRNAVAAACKAVAVDVSNVWPSTVYDVPLSLERLGYAAVLWLEAQQVLHITSCLGLDKGRLRKDGYSYMMGYQGAVLYLGEENPEMIDLCNVYARFQDAASILYLIVNPSNSQNQMFVAVSDMCISPMSQAFATPSHVGVVTAVTPDLNQPEYSVYWLRDPCLVYHLWINELTEPGDTSLRSQVDDAVHALTRTQQPQLFSFNSADQLYDALITRDNIGHIGVTRVSLKFWMQLDERIKVERHAKGTLGYKALTRHVQDWANDIVLQLAKAIPADYVLVHYVNRETGEPYGPRGMICGLSASLGVIDACRGLVPPKWGYPTPRLLSLDEIHVVQQPPRTAKTDRYSASTDVYQKQIHDPNNFRCRYAGY
ncbi:hypothetical protein BJV74DRAFT_797338 [Russula compacta]|nr:hypothetical protein BJV74DRAFT_797338 [Russula compacta]